MSDAAPPPLACRQPPKSATAWSNGVSTRGSTDSEHGSCAASSGIGPWGDCIFFCGHPHLPARARAYPAPRKTTGGKTVNYYFFPRPWSRSFLLRFSSLCLFILRRRLRNTESNESGWTTQSRPRSYEENNERAGNARCANAGAPNGDIASEPTNRCGASTALAGVHATLNARLDGNAAVQARRRSACAMRMASMLWCNYVYVGASKCHRLPGCRPHKLPRMRRARVVLLTLSLGSRRAAFASRLLKHTTRPHTKKELPQPRAAAAAPLLYERGKTRKRYMRALSARPPTTAAATMPSAIFCSGEKKGPTRMRVSSTMSLSSYGG